MFDFKILFAIIFNIISDENVNQVFSQIHVRVAYLFLIYVDVWIFLFDFNPPNIAGKIQHVLWYCNTYCVIVALACIGRRLLERKKWRPYVWRGTCYEIGLFSDLCLYWPYEIKLINVFFVPFVIVSKHLFVLILSSIISCTLYPIATYWDVAICTNIAHDVSSVDPSIMLKIMRYLNP
jgi:hypothetical protein